MAPAVATYAPRDPSHTVLYHVIAEHLETFLASCHDDPDGSGLPAYMAQMAAHLVEQVLPWVPTRQWVVSVPVPLRYWMASSQDLTAKVHTIIRRTIAQYYVNQAVQGGVERPQVHPGSVTFIQRFGSALQLNLHFHVICLEGVYLD